jgi:hypothetical protein
MSPPLPKSSLSVSVFALPTGKLYLPDRWLFEDGDNNMYKARQFSPDFSFLIRHPSGTNLLFDLGMRKVCYPPAPIFPPQGLKKHLL